jgi:hypothetical protein
MIDMYSEGISQASNLAIAPDLSASIIITCYNYGRFLNESIDSALNQAYPKTEVIVVDDGSSDNSRDVIASYGDRIIPVLKRNGGMGSAFNAGFASSRGDVVCFLDADDTIASTAMEKAVQLFKEPGVVKVHWPLSIVDECGRPTGGTYPSEALPEGDLRQCVIDRGENGYLWPMTSGNAWSRKFLREIFPMPEREYRDCGESYLATLAPAFGLVKSVSQPMGTYRMHERSLSNETLLSDMMKNVDLRYSALVDAFTKIGFEVHSELWEPTAKLRQQILTACEELGRVISPGSRFIFIDWNQWGPGKIVPDCQAIPFLENHGEYWGRPATDPEAIRELERLRRSGANFVVFGWPAFWWLDYYAGFRNHLGLHYRRLIDNDRLVVFDLAT